MIYSKARLFEFLSTPRTPVEKVVIITGEVTLELILFYMPNKNYCQEFFLGNIKWSKQL